MGKHRRKRDEEVKELSERLRELENRLKERKTSRHQNSDDHEARCSRPRSSRARSSQTRSSRTRSRSRGYRDQRYKSRDESRRGRTRRDSYSPYRQQSHSPSPLSIDICPMTPTQDNKKEGQWVALEKEADTEGMLVTLPETIPPGVEELLGDEGVQLATTPVELHGSLATRWSAIIVKGLNDETKQTILKKHEIPRNCSLLNPPKLNEEVAAAMNEVGIKRDQRIRGQQIIVAAAITSIGKVLNNLIANQDSIYGEQISTLSDAARLLCDIYHENCVTRRSLILPGLNKDMKELMEQTPISEYLFGDKLQDKFNAIKAVKKSGQELKNTPARPQARPKNLNSRGPYRQQFPRPSGQKIVLKRNNQVKQAATRPRRSPPQRRQPRRRGPERR